MKHVIGVQALNEHLELSVSYSYDVCALATCRLPQNVCIPMYVCTWNVLFLAFNFPSSYRLPSYVVSLHLAIPVSRVLVLGSET